PEPLVTQPQSRRLSRVRDHRAMAKHATIDEYIAALPAPLAETAARARAVIDARLDGASSAIKWAHPTWSLGKQPICYLKAASKHVTFGFWRGASIDAPSQRLETSGDVMAHVKLRSPADVDEERFADCLRQARELELARRRGSRQVPLSATPHPNGLAVM